MIGATPWRPPTGLPPWLGAILTVAAILLMVNSLPMIASAITPDRAAFVPSADEPPAPIPLPGQAAGAAATQAGTQVGTQAGTQVGTQVGTQAGTEAGETGAPEAPRPRKPLPISGGHTLPTLAAGGVLLAGGVGLLMMVGFTGDGPWPGRYVRRIG